MELIQKYTSFILDCLKISKGSIVWFHVPVFKVVGDQEIMHIKEGLCGKIEVKVKVKEQHHRFVIFTAEFDKYKLEFPLFVSRKTGPESIIDNFHITLKNLVNRTLHDNKEFELVEKLHREMFKNIKIEIIPHQRNDKIQK